MKRDMELIRKILFKIEEDYVSTALINLSIDGYSMEEVAYHCKILHDAGLVSAYNAKYASEGLYFFCVGSLTWEGHDYLDKIRNDNVWNKTKDVITKRGLPFVIDVVKDISTSIIKNMTEGAIKGLINQ